MSVDRIVELGREALLLTIDTSLPLVLAAMVVGLAISILQAATQVQEQTLTTVPKILAVFVMLLVGGAALVEQLSGFMTSLFAEIPSIGW